MILLLGAGVAVTVIGGRKGWFRKRRAPSGKTLNYQELSNNGAYAPEAEDAGADDDVLLQEVDVYGNEEDV
jgi:hypothetical protein